MQSRKSATNGPVEIGEELAMATNGDVRVVGWTCRHRSPCLYNLCSGWGVACECASGGVRPIHLYSYLCERTVVYYCSQSRSLEFLLYCTAYIL
jgi:hypothetical protein